MYPNLSRLRPGVLPKVDPEDERLADQVLGQVARNPPIIEQPGFPKAGLYDFLNVQAGEAANRINALAAHYAGFLNQLMQTPATKDAIQGYMVADYTAVNRLLRGQEPLDKERDVIRGKTVLEQLYRIFQNPSALLPFEITLLRSAKYKSARLSGSKAPSSGKAYLSRAFVSTSAAPIEKYLFEKGDLSQFYDSASGCCLAVIRCPRKFPVLPLFGNQSFPRNEEYEVLLPPGVYFAFVGYLPLQQVAQQFASKKRLPRRFSELRIPVYNALLRPMVA